MIWKLQTQQIKSTNLELCLGIAGNIKPEAQGPCWVT